MDTTRTDSLTRSSCGGEASARALAGREHRGHRVPRRARVAVALRLALVAGPEVQLQRRVAELIAEGRDDEDEDIVHVNGIDGDSSVGGSDDMLLAKAFLGHLQVHGHGHAHTALVIDSAENLTAKSVNAVLRPLQEWNEKASRAQAPTLGSFMGAKFTLQSITAIFVMNCTCTELSSMATNEPLRKLQAVLKAGGGPVPEPLRKVLNGHRLDIVPLIDASGYWQAVARTALDRRYQGAGVVVGVGAAQTRVGPRPALQGLVVAHVRRAASEDPEVLRRLTPQDPRIQQAAAQVLQVD